MPVAFLPDSRLYTDAGHFAANSRWPDAPTDGELLRYHAYWIGPLTAHHELSLKSLLITQSPPFEVWVWMSPDDLVRNAHVIDGLSVAPQVTFRAYVPEHEAYGTVFDGHVDVLTDQAPSSSYLRLNKLKQGQPAALSDGFRLVVLSKHGGVYFDLDMLFLKDLRPLCRVDFCYQWSNQPYGNSALSHFRKDSQALAELSERSVQIGICHPAQLLRFAELSSLASPLLVLPSFVFDPVWIAHDTSARINDYCNRIDDFFTAAVPITRESFFPASYAYHWHNRWTVAFRPGTIVAQLNAEVQAAFAAMRQPR